MIETLAQMHIRLSAPAFSVLGAHPINSQPAAISMVVIAYSASVAITFAGTI
jgi:hypothetical protein